MSPTATKRRSDLRVSAYDRVSSLLVAMLVISGLTVGGLLFLFFARQLVSQQVSIPVKSVTLPRGGGGGGSGDASLGTGGELELPADVMAEPELQIEDTLSAIAGAVEQRSPQLFSEQMEMELAPPEDARSVDVRRPGVGGAGGGRGTGLGTGTGSGRGPGLGGGYGGGHGTREPDRQIVFEPENLLEYARFLDFFGIELGVLGQDNKIYYAYNLSQKTPGVREGAPGDELRLYMNSSRGRFAALDLRLADRAGIADRGRIILQFYPEEAQGILYQLEQQRAEANGRKWENIDSTVFRVARSGERFEFTVQDQTYR